MFAVSWSQLFFGILSLPHEMSWREYFIIASPLLLNLFSVFSITSFEQIYGQLDEILMY